MKRSAAILLTFALLVSGCSAVPQESPADTTSHTQEQTTTTSQTTTTGQTTITSQTTTTCQITTATTTATEVSQTEPQEPVEVPSVTVEAEDIPTEEKQYGEIFGSARHIDGRTLIISIYSDDPTNTWDYTYDVDNETIEQTLYYLGIATDWISEQVSHYGANAEFIYDWKTAPDLKYEATFDIELEKDDYTYTESVYPAQRSYLYENIDSEALLEKYDADNIIYMFFIDSDFSNTANPVTSPRAYLYGDEFYTDHINLCVRFDEYYVTEPSSYAHEILHCFGAYDLYYENGAITAEYVMHCAESGSNDIMYYVTTGDEIYSDFTELDAYYIGLTDHSQDVKDGYLGLSDYV